MPDPVAVADVALDVPGQGCFTYAVPPELDADLAAGDCVLVPLGPRRVRGFVVARDRRPPPTEYALKAVLERRAEVRVPPHLLALIAWGAQYYRCSVGEFLAGAVPASVREGRAPEVERSLRVVAGFAGKLTPRQAAALAALPTGEAIPFPQAIKLAGCTRSILDRLVAAGALALEETQGIREIELPANADRHPPTAEQQKAIDAVAAELTAGKHAAFLLYGVTGSGKTLVYLELAERVIAAGRQVLFLVPEIALTPQLAARVRARIPRTVAWHSGFTDGERAELWRRVAAGGADLVLGTRSALFAPLPAPGLIIVDEEHEHTYKQESVPRYHARDLAVVYARQLAVPAILGSATPSLESVLNARAIDGRPAKYRVLTLRTRPAGAALPRPLVVDMRRACEAERRQVQLSADLVQRLGETLARGEQSIVLLNRRGWSPVVTCRSCGIDLRCDACDIGLTWHRAEAVLKCHYCGATRAKPERCPACGGALGAFGLGTEQLVDLVRQAVPGIRILRADADTVRVRQGHAQLLMAFANGEADCLIGTQMVAKGLDFPRVTLVGVVGADRGLAAPDFRAAERTYQLIAQVAGRAGRGSRPGTVVLQAFDTEALPLKAAITGAAKSFYDAELALRREYGYPPYAGLVRFLWSGPSAAAVQAAAETHGERLGRAAQGEAVLGPTPCAVAFIQGRHRWHALVKAASRAAAQNFLDRIDADGGLARRSGVSLAVDVDPVMSA